MKTPEWKPIESCPMCGGAKHVYFCSKQLKVGDKVMIYQDPLTKKRPEEEGVIKKIHKSAPEADGIMYSVDVKFPGERKLYPRMIWTGQAEVEMGFHPGHKIRWSYKSAIEFIALNDEPTGMNEQDIAGYISVHCLSAASGKPCNVIAHDVKVIRHRESLKERK